MCTHKHKNRRLRHFFRSDVLSGFLIGSIAASLTVSAFLIYNIWLLWNLTISVFCLFELPKKNKKKQQALYVSRLFKMSSRGNLELLPQSRGDVELQQDLSQASANKWLLHHHWLVITKFIASINATANLNHNPAKSFISWELSTNSK